MGYSKEVRDRIRELENEISELKKNNVVIPERRDMEELADLTGGYAEQFHTHISWIARASVCGTVKKSRCIRGRSSNARYLKNMSDLTMEEAGDVADCMREVMEVLLKYAQKFPYKVADNVSVGSVVITRNCLDVGLVAETYLGEPKRILARYSELHEPADECAQYGGTNVVDWYDTRITMSIQEWKDLSREYDAAGFNRYWGTRLRIKREDEDDKAKI